MQVDLNNIKIDFPLLTDDELEGEGWRRYYKKIAISIFNKSLSIDEYDKTLNTLLKKYSKEDLYLRFFNFFLSLSKDELCLFDDSDFININVFNIVKSKSKLLKLLNEEKDFKLIFAEKGVLYNSVFDFSGLLFLNSKCDIDNIYFLIKTNELNVIAEW